MPKEERKQNHVKFLIKIEKARKRVKDNKKEPTKSTNRKQLQI